MSDTYPTVGIRPDRHPQVLRSPDNLRTGCSGRSVWDSDGMPIHAWVVAPVARR